MNKSLEEKFLCSRRPMSVMHFCALSHRASTAAGKRIVVSLCCFILSACSLGDPNTDSNLRVDERFNSENIGSVSHYADHATGWTESDISRWYNLSQGSRLIPKIWFHALEQPDNSALFSDQDYLSRFGYIDMGDGLPLGFVADQWRKAKEFGTYSKPTNLTGDTWLGFNCSACHTGLITHKDQRYLVHGAPAMSDFIGFTSALLNAVKATLDSPDKLSRFSENVQAVENTIVNEQELRAELQAFYDWRKRLAIKNGSIDNSRYGFGRLDAVGHILNKVSLVADANESGEWPSDAPVSYPHIWNAPTQEFVQWNGLAANDTTPISIRSLPTDIGALGRNAGEVTGVFADVNVTEKIGVKGFDVHSSANAKNLIDLEQILGKLHSPKWPFGAIDEGLRLEGEALFDKHCISCHSDLAADDTSTKLLLDSESLDVQPKIVLNWLHEIGTDIWMACNTDQHSLRRAANGEILPGENGETVSGAAILTNVVEKTLRNQVGNVVDSVLEDTFGTGGARTDAEYDDPPDLTLALRQLDRRKRARAIDCLLKSFEGRQKNVDQEYVAAKRRFEKIPRLLRWWPGKRKKRFESAKQNFSAYQLLRYKARPLNGIWATAPYLHNGSVPTLFDLLLPSSHSNATGFELSSVSLVSDTAELPLDDSGRLSVSALQADELDRWAKAKSSTTGRRPDCFYVGSREYDVEKVGFNSPDCDESPEEPVPEQWYKFEVTEEIANIGLQFIPGNSNAGHNYPKDGLTDPERRSLLEYLKSL